jgi:hypothetical protein
MERSTILMGKSTINVVFSIAMLNYQRVVSLVSSGGRWLLDGVLYIPYAAAGEISSASSGSRSLEVEPSDEPMRGI